MRNLFKAIGICLVMFLYILPSHAQGKIFNIGPKVGLNIATQSGWSDQSDETFTITTSAVTGFHAGIAGQLNITPIFYIQPEFLFTQLGAEVESVYDGGSDTKSIKLNYLSLPIYATFGFNVGVVKIFVGVGGYFSLGISASDAKFEEGKLTDTGGPYFKKGDAGFTSMAGLQVFGAQLSLGYDLGLVDLIDQDGWKTVKDLGGLSSISNRNFKVSLAYFF